MYRYVAKRLVQLPIVVLAVLIVIFLLINMAPGDPADFLIGEVSDPAYKAMLRQRWGLDQPLFQRMLTYLSNVLRGDLGQSYMFGRPVFDVIMEKVPATLLLMGASFILSVVFGVILGTWAAKGKKPINALVTLLTIGYSIPVFWLGQILIIVFAVYLSWFPASGMMSLKDAMPFPLDTLWHLFLPAVANSLFLLAVTSRLTRGSVGEALEQDYILTARSKGLSENTVFFKHALRNALLPVVTMTGLRLGAFLSGAIFVETVFSWPGLGYLMQQATLARDYPLLLGLFAFISVGVIIVQLIVDVLYTFIDPRVGYQSG